MKQAMILTGRMKFFALPRFRIIVLVQTEVPTELVFSSNIGYYNQQGVIISNGYERYSGRFSMDFALNNWLSVGASLRGNYSVTDEIPSGDSQSSIMANLQRKLPYEPVYEPDGSYANRERPNLVAVANELRGNLPR
jgi:hypothetical protein